MGSEAEIKLPTIDFSILDLKSNTSANWESVKSQVNKALEEFGCFEAVFDKAPLELRKAIFDEVEELFNLPLQTKLQAVSSKLHRGYFVDPNELFESLGVDDAHILEDEVESFSRILWPEGKPRFSKSLQSFTAQISRLDQIIRKMFLESLGVEKYLEEHMNSTHFLTRLMKYKGLETNEEKVGLPAHTDKSILTILCQNQIDGLEVQTKSGDWIKCKPSSSSFSFFALTGDSLYAWTNGRVHVPFHRVVMRGNETRFSIAIFSNPKPGYIIKAPDVLVTEEYPLLFKPFEQPEFMKFLHSSGYVKNALKVYVGV